MTEETPLTKITRILPIQEKALKKLAISTVGDLLFHFPTRYGDTASKMNIGEVVKGENAMIFGKITGLKTGKAFRKGTPMSEAVIADETGKIKIIWFHQAYMAKMIAEGSLVRAEGKVSERNGLYSMLNPKIETVTRLPIGVGDSLFGEDEPDHSLYPVYPESKGITSLWMYHTIQKIFASGMLDTFSDPIPHTILQQYNLPNIRTALIWIHTPRKNSDAEAARKRFAFEEIFFIQLRKQRNRKEWGIAESVLIEPEPKELENFISRFPFPLTKAQRKTIDHVLKDFKSGHPMSRLLEGDVGSGKTAVAATATYAITVTRPKNQNFGSLQTAYMVPTEILAKQHFESFIEYFTHTGISIGLITGSGCRKFPSKLNPNGWTNISRSQLIKWVANGEIPIIIGTHALIQKTVTFKHLALAIIDEQHRFGTAQRQKLTQKNALLPHLLSMTATPIPRTLALTLYGDLDISLLDEMPHGRKPIITEIVLPKDRKVAYEAMRQELKAGRQAYVICARIDEPDPTKEGALLAKSVKSEAIRLKKEIFPEYQIGILHSKMSTSEKEKAMLAFQSGETDILVATSVVEVGVNVPNANIIVIEGGERFGLAQLHQLRGRVIRGNHQAYCFVFSETSGEKSTKRLKALKEAANGFALAELDLGQRGAGALYGAKQWGVSDLAMEALTNIKMVEAAREEARNILDADAELTSHPLLKTYLDSGKDVLHFE
jgi:ATP-dependent DNA helicase RecG